MGRKEREKSIDRGRGWVKQGFVVYFSRCTETHRSAIIWYIERGHQVLSHHWLLLACLLLLSVYCTYSSCVRLGKYFHWLWQFAIKLLIQLPFFPYTYRWCTFWDAKTSAFPIHTHSLGLNCLCCYFISKVSVVVSYRIVSYRIVHYLIEYLSFIFLALCWWVGVFM